MLHEAIFLATCLATMTTEKHCKLQRGCHTFAIIFFATCNAPGGNCLQLFLRQLEISCEEKTGSDCIIFTKLHCRFRWTCHTKDISTFSCNSQRNILLPLQVAKLGCYMWNLSCNLSRNKKLQEKLPRVTWPLDALDYNNDLLDKIDENSQYFIGISNTSDFRCPCWISRWNTLYVSF